MRLLNKVRLLQSGLADLSATGHKRGSQPIKQPWVRYELRPARMAPVARILHWGVWGAEPPKHKARGLDTTAPQKKNMNGGTGPE